MSRVGSPPQEIRSGPPAVRAPLDAGDFRRAIGRFATGVTILTTIAAAEGRHLGMTANSFVSVSLDPLLVLVSIRRDARFHAPLLAAGVWGVSVLAADMAEASGFFARHAYEQSGDMFAQWPHTIGEQTGVVLLDGALSAFECRTVSTHLGGDHTLVIGEVVSLTQSRDDAAPLVFFEGKYLDTAPSREPVPAQDGGTERAG